MAQKLLLALVLILALSASTCRGIKDLKESKAAGGTVARGVDLKRYAGRWYEIASFPTFFQPKNGVDTRATYTLNPNGTVGVVNEVWSNGKRSFIEGIAYKADPSSDEAKLKVKFKVPTFLPVFPVTGDYWILYVDPNYHHALIGGPTKLFLWILARETRLDEGIYNQLVQMAKDQGYGVNKLHKTPQHDPPPL